MTLTKFTLILLLTASSLSAAVLGQWTFNDTSSLENALAASNVFGDAEISGLQMNSYAGFGFGFAGLDHVPADDHDGYGFGGAGQDAVMFLHRATYMNADAPANNYTSFGLSPYETQGTADNLGDGNAPISFIVTAGNQALQVDGISLNLTSAGELLFTFQATGATEGVPATVTAGSTVAASLASPVVIAAGASRTFTLNLASIGLDSFHNLNALTLHGTLPPESSHYVSIPEAASYALLGGLLALGFVAIRRR